MGKFSLANATKSMKTSVEKHTPEILMGIGISGMLSAGILAVKATPKALRLIEAKKKESGVEKLSKVDTVKATWKCYIPSVVITGASIACLIGSNKVSLKRNAALATAYKIAETAHREYREKVIETIGEKKEELVNDKIAKDKVDKNPVSNCEVIVTGKGKTLCLDALSGRYFEVNIDVLEKAQNALNRQIINQNYVSLNEFYREIGLDDIELGDELGWNVDNFIALRYSSQLADDNRPCLVVSFEVAPKYDYSKLY